MLPHRKLIPQGIESSLVPSEATNPGIFGLPDPEPESWVKYRDYKGVINYLKSTLCLSSLECINIWDHLLSCCRREKELVLLKIDLVEKDHPRVFDYVHMRRMAKDLTWSKFLFDSEAYRKRIAEGNRDYWNSGVDLFRYDGSFILPEIVVFSAIPIERVSVIKGIEKELNVA